MKITINLPKDFEKDLITDKKHFEETGLTEGEYISATIKRQLIAVYKDNKTSAYMREELEKLKAAKEAELQTEIDKLTIEITED